MSMVMGERVVYWRVWDCFCPAAAPFSSRYCEPCWESWHRRGEIPPEDEDEAGAKEEN